jgi:hypothetical protein
LDIAIDEAGNRLAQVIAEHRKEWLALLAEGEAEAAAHFNLAITEAQAAIADLRPTRGALGWLNQFDADRAQSGQNAPFAGGRLRVKSKSGTLRGEHDPAVLLELAARVTEAPVHGHEVAGYV